MTRPDRLFARARPFLRENWYRDVWLFVISMLILYAVVMREGDIRRSEKVAMEARQVSTRVAAVERQQDKWALAAVVDACVARNQQARHIVAFVVSVAPERARQVDTQFPRESDCHRYARDLLSGKRLARDG